MDLAIVNRVIGIMYDTGRTDIETCEKQFFRVRDAVVRAKFDICDLKPLAAKFKNCDPDIDSIMECVENGQLRGRTMLTQVAQALNWERTEFDTLDELLEAISENQWLHSHCEANQRTVTELSNFLECAPEHDAIMAVVKENERGLRQLELHLTGRLRPVAATAAVLHGTEYYPGSTILLQTAQLVVWRDADGQEHCKRAHRVTLNPDRDGLAAAILSGIAGAQIAPEHIAELRAQMGGVL